MLTYLRWNMGKRRRQTPIKLGSLRTPNDSFSPLTSPPPSLQRNMHETRDLETILFCSKTKNDGTNFTFVHLSCPEESRRPSIQKVVRRHVMSRIATSRKKRALNNIFELEIPQAKTRQSASNASQIHGSFQRHALYVLHHIPESLQPYSFFPVEPDPRARQLMHFSTFPSDRTSSRVSDSLAC